MSREQKYLCTHSNSILVKFSKLISLTIIITGRISFKIPGISATLTVLSSAGISLGSGWEATDNIDKTDILPITSFINVPLSTIAKNNLTEKY